MRSRRDINRVTQRGDCSFWWWVEVRRKITAVSSHKKCLTGVYDALHHRKKAKSIDGEKSTRTLEAGLVGEDEYLDATY